VLGGPFSFSLTLFSAVRDFSNDFVEWQRWTNFANRYAESMLRSGYRREARSFISDFVTWKQQVKFARQYKRNMLADGYKREFVDRVFVAMLTLYKNGIEELLPEDISSVSDVVYDPECIAMRKEVTDKLSQIMKNNGADYDIINRYLKAQQQSSWSEQSLTMKYFLFTQREESADFEKIYFWSGHNLSDLELRHIKEVIKNVKKEANDGGSISISKIKKEKYAQSVAMYKAFTAIALNKAKIPGKINHKNNTCSLQRGMKREDLIKFYPEYAKINEGEIFTGTMKHGIADSAALGAPASEYTNPKEYDVIEMKIPFHRVLAAYFVSPELSFDGPLYGIPINPYTRDNKAGKGSEHELICDMANLPVKIRKMSTIKWFLVPSYAITLSYAKAMLKAFGHRFK
jgi:hypothetical protein